MAGERHLKDCVVLLVGASSGMGKATAKAAADAGATVVLAARNEAELTSIQADIEGNGGSAMSVATDATDRASVATTC